MGARDALKRTPYEAVALPQGQECVDTTPVSAVKRNRTKTLAEGQSRKERERQACRCALRQRPGRTA